MLIPFTDAYLQLVIKPRLATVVDARAITSVDQFRREFNDAFSVKISYDMFRGWLRDLGITLTKAVLVDLGDRDHVNAPPPIKESPTSDGEPAAMAEVSYNINDPREPQNLPAVRGSESRGGISLNF